MTTQNIGFIGIGAMGEPMCLNLINAGIPLTIWNRTADKCQSLVKAGATLAASKNELFKHCDVIFLMLTDHTSIDAVLDRNQTSFKPLLEYKTIINTSTVEAGYSKALMTDITEAGGIYIEAPISGSKKPAEAGKLITMIAGEAKVKANVTPLLEHFSKKVIDCGTVPNALLMKFAVNVFLITSVTGLAESLHFAQAQGLSTLTLVDILNHSQMASEISKVKTQKIINNDLSKQASIADVLKNNQLITNAAQMASVSTPLMQICQSLYQEALDLGHSELDMITVIKALEDRTKEP